MKSYFEYIAENDKPFFRTRSTLILVVSFLSILVYIGLTGKKELDDYQKFSGNVKSINPNIIKVNPGGTFDLRKSVDKEVVDIYIGDTRFIVQYQIERYKEYVLENVKQGEYVDVYFQNIDGYHELIEIIKGETGMLDFNERMNGMSVLNTIILIVLFALIFVFSWILVLRRKFKIHGIEYGKKE